MGKARVGRARQAHSTQERDSYARKISGSQEFCLSRARESTGQSVHTNAKVKLLPALVLLCLWSTPFVKMGTARLVTMEIAVLTNRTDKQNPILVTSHRKFTPFTRDHTELDSSQFPSAHRDGQDDLCCGVHSSHWRQNEQVVRGSD